MEGKAYPPFFLVASSITLMNLIFPPRLHRTLATAGDRGHIYLYCLPPGRPLSFWLRQSTSSKIIARLCHTTQTDIYDLCWSPDSKEMVTVSVDNKVSFWTMHNGKAVPKESFTSHSNYVQGVAWDPRNKVDRYMSR